MPESSCPADLADPADPVDPVDPADPADPAGVPAPNPHVMHRRPRRRSWAEHQVYDSHPYRPRGLGMWCPDM